MGVKYQSVYTYYSGHRELVVAHGGDCEIISKYEFQSSKRGGSNIYITSQLIDILADRVGFDPASRLLLDVGGTYVLDSRNTQTVDDEFMLVAHIAKNPYIRQAVSVDIRPPTLQKHRDMTILGSLLDIDIQHKILDTLQGKPNIVVSSQVLINDLEEYMQGECIRVPVGNKLLHEELAKVAWDLLDDGGLLLVNNKCPIKNSDAGIPEFLRDKSDHLRFLVEDGLTRVYQK